MKELKLLKSKNKKKLINQLSRYKNINIIENNSYIWKKFANIMIINLEKKIIVDSIIGYKKNYINNRIKIFFDKSNVLTRNNYIELDYDQAVLFSKHKENNLFGKHKFSYKYIYDHFSYDLNSKINKKLVYEDGKYSNYCHHCNYILSEKYLFRCQNNYNGNKNNEYQSYTIEEKNNLFYGFKYNKISCNKEFCVNCLKNVYYMNLDKIDLNKFVCLFCTNNCFCNRCENRDMIIKICNIIYDMFDNKTKILINNSPIENLIYLWYKTEAISIQNNNPNLFLEFLEENKCFLEFQLEMIKLIKQREILKNKKLNINHKSIKKLK